MLIEVIPEIKNAFEIEPEQSTFTIENEVLTGFKNDYPIGSYILIERRKQGRDGSILNSGYYLVGDDLITLNGARNETWSGTIWLCSPPSDFIALVGEIEENVKNTPQTGKQSESFGIYSYSMATNDKGVPMSWLDVYASRLVPFRNKMFMNVNI